MSSFVNWVTSGVNCAMVPSLTEVMCTPDLFGWLSLVLLDIEFMFEKETNLWNGFREEIYNDPKISPSQALKVCHCHGNHNIC